MTYKTRDTLVYGSTYEGYPVMQDKGPFIKRGLNRIIDVMHASLAEHPRTFAVRIDLRYPLGLKTLPEARLIDRFISSLKSKIQHARIRAGRRAEYRVHQTSVRYVWGREIGQKGNPHYHFVIFLNRDAFNSLGKYGRGRDNLFNRISEAWASALGIADEDAIGLAEIPKNAKYSIRADDFDSQDDFIYRASYLAKAATKVTGHRQRFGGSRS